MGRSATVTYACDRCTKDIPHGERTRISTRLEGAHEGHCGEDVGCAFDGSKGPEGKCYPKLPAGLKPIARREKKEEVSA